MGNLVAHDVVASLIYFCSIYTYFFFINLEDICVYVMEGNTQVLDEELNLLLVGFFWDGIPYGTISFINWINRKSCTQHTYTIFFIKFCNTLRVSMSSG